ncbi:hypothetical protein CBL_04211 [Carabus blaptoides fortunei]
MEVVSMTSKCSIQHWLDGNVVRIVLGPTPIRLALIRLSGWHVIKRVVDVTIRSRNLERVARYPRAARGYIPVICVNYTCTLAYFTRSTEQETLSDEEMLRAR